MRNKNCELASCSNSRILKQTTGEASTETKVCEILIGSVKYKMEGGEWRSGKFCISFLSANLCMGESLYHKIVK